METKELKTSPAPNVPLDNEELLNGLGSELMDRRFSEGNHMARTDSRWGKLNVPQSGSDKDDTSRSGTAGSVDSVHKPIKIEENVAPGQLYATDSGKLFHAGKILIVLVGLPATSKTALSVAITRYTRWLGVRAESFHISKYRKEMNYSGDDCYSAVPETKVGKEFRKSLLESVFNDMIVFFQKTKGQIAVYDALNIRKEDRTNIHIRFANLNIKVIFIESIVKDPELYELNLLNAAKASEFENFTKEQTQNILKRRLQLNKSFYQKMSKDEKLCYIKFIDFGKEIIVNNIKGGYLINKIVFFLMNLRNTNGKIYFSRCGTSEKDNYLNDEELNKEGIDFAHRMTDVIMERVSKNEQDPDNQEMARWKLNALTDSKPLHVFTAERKRTYDTGQFFAKKYNIPVYQRMELKQLREGSVADLSEEEKQNRYPTEYQEYLKDPYHYRFPRAESYHDLAIRMEPFLLELERISGDILIIAHESTLRVLYGYFMASSCQDLWKTNFSRDEITEITITPFQNQVRKIPI
ncbi:hypothetical protein TPHA_0K01240 [Tetrapisispora phaffii CBS 4417]|uniref:6-phosphofructo-2-kinase domain-containing protein n=1 Tax=Tetrapisispora phaffii (strain ATCC 24235 / CBS 4417 / NBRC 1672 / NRRL Y-8282 / UCD 70-5) TaxID=1071381 RepID=G8BZD0_TETPH|nr:hypothetical protein TPHA_0K01240 [Tetrapisispora phaffii CBS 4417]CCE65258.1 hypothetical protein TPHA_0K01240 [Tetrapisispora phaffii CBS 4417]